MSALTNLTNHNTFCGEARNLISQAASRVVTAGIFALGIRSGVTPLAGVRRNKTLRSTNNPVSLALITSPRRQGTGLVNLSRRRPVTPVQEGYAMTALLSISDINTTVNHEPRVAHQRLAKALGMSRSNELARLIERNYEELERYGVVCGMIPQTTPKGGRPGKTYWLNEPQALLVTIRSDAPLAAEVRQSLINVFMAYRHGTLAVPQPDMDDRAIEVAIVDLFNCIRHLSSLDPAMKFQHERYAREALAEARRHYCAAGEALGVVVTGGKALAYVPLRGRHHHGG